eukprot:5777920-Pyramimonas_sp.AAC.1
MAPKRRAPAGGVVAASGGTEVDRLKERNQCLEEGPRFLEGKSPWARALRRCRGKQAGAERAREEGFHRCQAAAGRRLHRGRAGQIDAARQAAARRGVAR